MNRQLRHLLVLALVLGLGAFSSQSYAESNPFNGQTVIQNNGPSDGSANDPIVKNSIGDVNSIQDNSALNDTRGRREKIEDDAIPKGQAGVAAAIAAGVSLTAAGTPMLASPFIPVQIRGAQLLAKAGLEFAQAAATAGVNQQNRKAADAVNKNSDGPTGSQLPSPEEVRSAAAESINTPELQQALGNAGVNSDYFVSQLVSGALSSPEAVLSAAGADTSQFTSDQLAASDSASASSTNGHEEVARITFNDGTAANTGVQGGTTSSGAERGFTVQSGQRENLEGVGGAAPGSNVFRQAQELAARAIEAARRSGTDKILNLNEKDLVEKYLANLLKGKANNQSQLLSDIALYDIGVKRLRRKQNIFHVARKSYRDFKKWRSKRPARLTRTASIAPLAK